MLHRVLHVLVASLLFYAAGSEGFVLARLVEVKRNKLAALQRAEPLLEAIHQGTHPRSDYVGGLLVAFTSLPLKQAHGDGSSGHRPTHRLPPAEAATESRCRGPTAFTLQAVSLLQNLQDRLGSTVATLKALDNHPGSIVRGHHREFHLH